MYARREAWTGQCTVTISAPYWIFSSIYVLSFLKCFGCIFRSVHLFSAICSLRSDTWLVVLKIRSGRCKGAVESCRWKLLAMHSRSLGWPCEGQELRRSFLGPVPSSVAEPVGRHKPLWQQQIMRVAASSPGGGKSSCVFFWMSSDHIGTGGFFGGGHFEIPIFEDVVFVLLHGLLFCLSPLKVEWEGSCCWCYPTSAEESNWSTILWLCKANDTGQRQREAIGLLHLMFPHSGHVCPISQCNG